MTKTVHDETTAVNSGVLRGFVVDHLAKSIVERAIPRRLFLLYSAAAVGGFPGRSPLSDRLSDVVYVRMPDVSGRPGTRHLWAINGRRRWLTGRGLILGATPCGQARSATVTLGQLRANIWFVERDGSGLRVWPAEFSSLPPIPALSGRLPFPQAFRE